jgi:hypothetical protein
LEDKMRHCGRCCKEDQIEDCPISPDFEEVMLEQGREKDYDNRRKT